MFFTLVVFAEYTCCKLGKGPLLAATPEQVCLNKHQKQFLSYLMEFDYKILVNCHLTQNLLQFLNTCNVFKHFSSDISKENGPHLLVPHHTKGKYLIHVNIYSH